MSRDDSLHGGAGKDVLTGGDGSDTFVFESYIDSRPKTREDMITDFKTSELDHIDVSGIDANTTSGWPHDNEFTWIGTHKFHTFTGGELRYSYKGGNTVVEGDVDGDAKAEFVLVLKGHLALEDTDFML